MGGSIFFKFKFENPELVSIGTKKDVVIGTIIDESFFCSANSPSVITRGSKITAVLPRLLPGETMGEVLEAAESTIESTAQSMMTSQLILTLVLSVSLKQMWNLFTVMQVLSYTRNFCMWPAML